MDRRRPSVVEQVAAWVQLGVATALGMAVSLSIAVKRTTSGTDAAVLVIAVLLLPTGAERLRAVRSRHSDHRLSQAQDNVAP